MCLFPRICLKAALSRVFGSSVSAGAASPLLAAVQGPLCHAGDPEMDESLVLGSPFHLVYQWQQLSKRTIAPGGGSKPHGATRSHEDFVA